MSRPRTPLMERFTALVSKSDGCWDWGGSKNKNTGYGKVLRGGSGNGSVLAHRASWELHNGPIPDGMCVCHRCDNRSCVNPDHLFLGTHADNSADMVAKGRSTRGERGGHRSLTEDDVFSIIDEYKDGVSRAAIAKKHGVAKSTIYHIMERRIWAHLTEPTVCAH